LDLLPASPTTRENKNKNAETQVPETASMRCRSTTDSPAGWIGQQALRIVSITLSIE
jgi:hypothetical protein